MIANQASIIHNQSPAIELSFEGGLYKAMYEHSSDAIMLLGERGFIDCNESTLKMFGMGSREQFLGLSPFDLSPHRQADGRESKEAAEEHINKARREGSDHFAWVHKDRAGREFPADVLLTAIEHDGHTILEATVRDLTAKRLMERELEQIRSFLHSIVENLPNMVFVKDADELRFVLVNREGEKLMGYPESDLIGKTDYDFFPREQAEFFIANDRKVLENSQLVAIAEEPIRCGDGKTRYLRTKKIPILDDERRPRFLLGISEDITELKASEQALRASEERFALAMQGASDGLWDWDLKTDALYISPRWKSMLGYEDEELVNSLDTWRELLHPEDKQETIRRVEEYKARLTPKFEFEFRMCHKKGGYRNILSRGVAVRDDAGKAVRLIGTHVDITEHKLAENAMKSSVDTLHAVTNSVQEAIVLFDADGRVRFWNEAASRILRYPNLPMTVYNSGDRGGDCNADPLSDAIQKFLQHSRETTSTYLETELKRCDGTTFPAEVSLSKAAINVRPHTVVVVRDITERVARESDYQQTVKRFMAMINTVPAWIYVKDIDQKYIAANEAFCKAVGRPLDEILQCSDYDLFPFEKADNYQQTDQIVLDEDRKIISDDDRFVDASGEERWVSVTKVPLHDSQRLVAGVVGLVQDVTEHHRSRQQLIQSDKLAAIGTLAAGVAHEINNPIGFISSNLTTMSKYVDKIAAYIQKSVGEAPMEESGIKDILTDFGEAIAESVEGATRVKNIVADLKSFSRVDKAQACMANLNEGIDSTLNIVWNELKYKCTVEKEFGDIPDLMCIPNQLNQVFMNLLLNASHAIKSDSGTIKIATWADDKNIFVRVTDNGEGIKEKDMKKIFEPFFTTKDVGKGTGLGLSLAYDIIKKHNGQISVKSEVGRGTEFTISLPLEGVSNESAE